MRNITGMEDLQVKGCYRIAFGRTLPTIAQLKQHLAAEAMKRTRGNISAVEKMLGISRESVLKCLQNGR